MSFERISILATLCVCMCVPNTLYAGQPTVRASIVRPNTNGDQSTSVKQKATQITGGLGTIGGLHTNRVQTGLIPTSSSNKQIANVRDEIQQIKDEFAQELTAYRQEIQELKQELDAKKEQLATLQETLSDYEDMKKTIKDIPETVGREIERRSFITTDAVASEIATAKAAAIKDAKNAALSAVNDMGFAKRVDVTGAINELETQIGNNFVTKNKLNSELGKSDVIKDIQSGIETNANAISSNSEKFETIADDLLSDSEFKGQILDSLDSDIKSLPGAVQEIQNTISAMPRNYVKASELESKVTDITDDKFVKPSDIGGIISDNKLVRQNEMTVAISAVETNVGNTYATKAMVKSTDDKINGLDGKFALKSDYESLGDTFALRDELKSYVTSSDFDAAAAAFLPKAQFNSTAIANGFIKNDALDDFVPRTEFDNISDTIADSLLADTAFKDTIIGGLGDDVQGLFTTVDGLSSQFAAWKSRFEDEEDGWDRLVETLNGLSGRVDGFEGKFALTSDLDGAVALLDSKISNWNNKFASWENRFNDEENGWDRLRESLYELRGQVSGFGSTYVTISDFNTKANEWALNYDGGRFALSSDLTTLSNQWNTRFSGWETRFNDEESGWGRLVSGLTELRGQVSGFGNTYVTISGFNTKANEWALNYDGGRFALASELTTLSNQWNTRFSGWETRFNDEESGWERLVSGLTEVRGQVSGFGNTYVKIGDFNTKANEWALNYDGGRFALASDLTTLSNQWNTRFSGWETRFNDEESGWGRLVSGLTELRGQVSGFGSTYVTISDFNTKANEWASKYTGFDSKFALASDLDNFVLKSKFAIQANEWASNYDGGRFALASDLTTLSNQWNTRFSGWETRFNDEESGWERLVSGLTEVRGQVSGFGNTYVTISGFNTKANEWALNYDGGRFALSTDLGNYVLSSSLTTTLGNYATTDALATNVATITRNLGDYVKSDAIVSTLANKGYNFANYLKVADLDTKLNASSVIQGLVTTAQLNEFETCKINPIKQTLINNNLTISGVCIQTDPWAGNTGVVTPTN